MVERWSRFEDNRLGSYEEQELRREMAVTEELDRGRRVRLLADDVDRELGQSASLTVGQRTLATTVAVHLRAHADCLDREAGALRARVPVPALSPELQVLFDQAMATFNALSPEEQQAHMDRQRDGWIESIRREIADREAGLGTV